MKLPTFFRDITKYADFKAQFKALTADCGYPVPCLLENLSKSIPQGFLEELEGTVTLEEAWKLLDP